MRPAGRFAVVALLVAAGAATGPATAGTEGRVLDPDKKPIAGARVCYMIGEAEGVCVEADADGRFDLPASHMSTYRVEATGFQPRMLTVGEHKGPIVLERAAAMWVRVRDAATGRTVQASEVFLIMPDGHREGPLPANDKGVKIRTLLPGQYGVVVHSEGYTQAKAVSVALVAGAEKWVDVEMKSVDPPKAKR